MRFMKIFFDASNWQYTIATIYKEKNKDIETDEVIWGDPQLCGYTFPTEFTHGLKLFFSNAV